VTVDPVTDVAIQGDYAYVATLNGLRIYNVAPVMDANAATMLPGGLNPLASLLVGNAFDAAYTVGSTVLLTPTRRVGVQTNAEGIYSVDISNPAQPEVQGFFPINGETSACAPLGDTSRRMRARIAVSGSRAYYTSGGTLRTLNLE
jgi:hypothetical protein